MKMCISRTLVSLSLVILGVEGAVVRKEAHVGRVTAADKHDGARLTAVAHHDGVVADAAKKGSGGKIVPPLVDVTTDKKFFGPPFPADYPDDVQPAVKDKKLFSKTKVYPKVQDEDRFDKDFVKDENSDGGKWKAQQDYDAARTKLANQKSQAENAAKRAANEAKDVENAEKRAAERQKTEEEADKEAREAEGKEASERDSEKRAHDKVGQKQAEHDTKVAQEAQREAEKHKTAEEKQKETEEKVRKAEEALAKEKESYANCAKQLEEAKARVKALQDEQAAVKKGSGTAPPSKHKLDVDEEEKAVAEAQAKTKAAETAHQETLEKLEAAHHEAEAAKKEMAHQKAEKEEAQAAEAKEEKEMKEAEEELAESRSRLRRTRGPNAVPAGEAEEPTAPPPKAGAVTVGRSAVVAVAVATLLFM